MSAWSILSGAVRIVLDSGQYILKGNVIGPGSINSALFTSGSGLFLNSDGTVRINDDGVTSDYAAPKFIKRATGDLSDGTAGGGVLSLANPEGVRLIITRLVIDLTGTSSAAATIDGGTAAGATTSSDNLVDGLDVNSSTLIYDNIRDAVEGNNGKTLGEWSASGYLTISQATGTVTGMTGRYMVEYYDPA